MKKKILIVSVLLCSIFMYGESIQDLLNEASNAYSSNDIDKAIDLLERATNNLKTEKLNQNTDEIETVEFTRLKNFPSRYNGKKIKLLDTAISSKIGKKFNGDYRITVNSVNQSSYFYEEPYEDGSLFFVISEELVEKLMDRVAAGYVGYFNVYTDTIYSYTDSQPYLADKTYYVAKIVSLECLTYYSYNGTTSSLGIFLTE